MTGIEILWQETANFAEGYQGNLMISAFSMLLGTLIGGLLGCVRAGYSGLIRAGAEFLTSICRNVPSFVLLFYMAFMIPNEVTWLDGTILKVPLWFKATVALTFPVIGFASDQTLAYFTQYRARISGAGETFWVAWVQYFLIIIMASATASVIGADEIVGRANTVIARSDDAGFLLMTYGYVSLWFLATGLAVTGVLKLVLGLRARPDGLAAE